MRSLNQERTDARSARAAPLWRRIRFISSGHARATSPAFEFDWRRAPLWAPVAFGAGIAFYFSLAVEPRPVDIATALAAISASLCLLRNRGAAVVLILAALLLASLGVAAGAVRARLVAAPVLAEAGDYRVGGRLLSVSRSGGGTTRLLFDRVAIPDLQTPPARIRVTAPGIRADDFRPGDRFAFDAFLAPPPGPTEPGGFDFRRRAWFDRLGAVGRLESGLTSIEPEKSAGYMDWALTGLTRLRADIASYLRAAMPGAEGAFAAAILVGDRAAIPPRAVEDLRASNLAHLLAISGLHMALVTGLAFAAMRIAVALVPPLSLRFSGKKIAAVAALVAGLAYLALSGASVATQRAVVMVAVALVAILLDRPAVTLRALALAALIVLAIRPETLMGPGFQMSFAATAALVAVYGETRERWREARLSVGIAGRLGLYVGALALTSLVAGAATAPFAAHHFNRLTSYGLIANVAAAPVMALWVMPSAMIAGALAPLGLDGVALDVMAKGVAAILAVARWVANLPDATRMVAEAPPFAFALLTIGGLMLCISRSAGRLAGLILVGWACAHWWMGARPDVLIAERGRLIGVMGAEGRALSFAGGRSDFIASTWLRRDGDEARPKEAAARRGVSTGKGWVHAQLAHGWRLEGELYRVEQARLEALCQTRVILVAPRAWRPPAGACLFIGPEALDAGPLAVSLTDDDQAVVETAAEKTGRRLWTGNPP